MGQVKTEVDNAVKALGLTTKDISLIDYPAGEILYKQLLSHFVKSGNRHWWWEDFRHDSFSFHSSVKTFQLLNEIIPKTNGKVWFMVEDDEETHYPIYDANPFIIKDILGKCFLFEYYIIDKNMAWLICETHDNQIIGIGEDLKAFKSWIHGNL